MLGSHNSMSYLPPQNLWGKITRPWNKCQNKTLVEQYKAGARYFDIRVRMIKGIWYFVHNKVNYGWFIDNLDSIDTLEKLAEKDNQIIHFRIILDERKRPFKSEVDNDKYIDKFYNFILHLFPSALYKNLDIDSMIVYWNWKELLRPDIEVKEFHSSVTAKWYQYLLGCKWFANRYNDFGKCVNTEYVEDTYKVLLLDYV